MLKPTDFPSMGNLKALNEWNRIAEADRIREHHMKAMADRSLPIIEGDMPQKDYPDLRGVERVEPYLYVCSIGSLWWLEDCLRANRALIGNEQKRNEENSTLFDSQMAKETNLHLAYIPDKNEQKGIYTTIPINVMNVLVNIDFNKNNPIDNNHNLIDDNQYQDILRGYANWNKFQEQNCENWDW